MNSSLIKRASRTAEKVRNEVLIRFISSHQKEEWDAIFESIASFEQLPSVAQDSLVLSCQTMMSRKTPVKRTRVPRIRRSESASQAEKAVRDFLERHLEIFKREAVMTGLVSYNFSLRDAAIHIKFKDMKKSKA